MAMAQLPMAQPPMALGVAAAVVAVCLLLPDRTQSTLRRLAGNPARTDAASWRLGLAGLVAAGCVLAVPVVVRLTPHLLLVAATAAGIAWSTVALLRRGRRRSLRSARRRQVVDMCDALVAELQAGQPPGRALAWVARTWPELESASTVAGLGGDVPAALRELANRPGAEPLGQIAAGWEVAHRSGAGLADVLDRLSRSLRDDEDVRREVSASLGPTRATGRLLAVLPAFGIGLGFTMGADPLAVLLGSALGSACLAFGAGLAIVGIFWIERIADRAEV